MAVDETNLYAQWLVWELAEIVSITNEYSDWPAYHLIDGSLKSAWAHLAADANQEIVYDLNKTDLATGIYGGGFFIKDYETDHSNSATATFTVEFSNDDISYDAAVIDESISADAVPVQIFDTSSITPKRYIRFTFKDISPNIEISQLFFGRKITLGSGPQLESLEPKTYYNQIGTGRGPQSGQQVTAVVRDGVQSYLRTYIGTSTLFDNIELAYDISAGRRGLIVMVDELNSVSADPIVVRISSDVMTSERLSSGIYKIQLPIIAVPFYTDGYNY